MSGPRALRRQGDLGLADDLAAVNTEIEKINSITGIGPLRRQAALETLTRKVLSLMSDADALARVRELIEADINEELDAIHPEKLRFLVEHAITRHISKHEIDTIETAEKSERELLKLFKGYAQVHLTKGGGLSPTT